MLFLLALPSVVGAAAVPPPWQRTETRAPCSEFNPLRAPYFGETHVHTARSADAALVGIIAGPREAYQFATGAPLGLPPFDALGVPAGTAQISRPLDFTAVTDHAESFGETNICFTPGQTGYDSSECVAVRNQLAAPLNPLPPPSPPLSFIQFLFNYGQTLTPTRFSWCGAGGANCLSRASLVWQEEQDAAEEFYDRTAACSFTTFVAYEWSATPNGNNLHRNVIFRNDAVPPLPISYMERQTPQGLWAALHTDCLDNVARCDVLAIPHNSNVSGGLMFQPLNPDGSMLSATDAATRQAFEPLVEIIQHKGESECRPGVGTTDELCGFEAMNRTQLFGATNPTQTFQPLSFVRNGLKQGLVEEARTGVNPFKYGFVGSTDSHNGTPGAVEEDTWRGHNGLRDRNPTFMLTRYAPSGVETNPGGLAVLWAEENSRDALFAAMQRREAYATSGTRPIVRFFGGRLPSNLCDDPAFAEHGYQAGVPMGGELGPVQGKKSPRFAVLAQRDPGRPGNPGMPLQHVQIIKGWIDSTGTAQEQVFEIAGDPNNGASVDTTTCTPSGAGFDSLCQVWEDPAFDRSQRAFYYARVLENPVCRWSTHVCNQLGLDCSNPGSVPAELSACCDPLYPKAIQERAWTSPIWYRPEGVAKLKARVKFGKSAGHDLFKLTATLGDVTPELDPATRDLTVQVRDDDEIYAVTIPAGTMQPNAHGFGYRDPGGSLNGLSRASLVLTGKGEARLTLRTVPMDLSHADASQHMVHVTIASGTYSTMHNRLWSMSGSSLASPR
jgi:hypothetical protein